MNDPYNIPKWWCCVVPGYRALIQVIIAQNFITPLFCEKTVYTAASALILGVPDSYRQGALLNALYLTPGELPLPEGGVIEGYLLDPIFWAAMALFLATPASICSRGCSLNGVWN